MGNKIQKGNNNKRETKHKRKITRGEHWKKTHDREKKEEKSGYRQMGKKLQPRAGRNGIGLLTIQGGIFGSLARADGLGGGNFRSHKYKTVIDREERLLELRFGRIWNCINPSSK